MGSNICCLKTICQVELLKTKYYSGSLNKKNGKKNLYIGWGKNNLTKLVAQFLLQFSGEKHDRWSTKTCLYNIREPRYKQIKMGYQISDFPYCLTYISAPFCFTDMDMYQYQPSKMFITRETRLITMRSKPDYVEADLL